MQIHNNIVSLCSCGWHHCRESCCFCNDHTLGRLPLCIILLNQPSVFMREVSISYKYQPRPEQICQKLINQWYKYLGSVRHITYNTSTRAKQTISKNKHKPCRWIACPCTCDMFHIFMIALWFKLQYTLIVYQKLGMIKRDRKLQTICLLFWFEGCNSLKNNIKLMHITVTLNNVEYMLCKT